jgi:hypothetical protein
MTHIARWMESFRNRRDSAKSRRRIRNRAPRCERLEDRNLLATIQGVVFEDVHNDGARDTGDPTMAGIEVYLDQNNSGTLDTGEVATTTDAGGAYEFAGLAAGDYIVRQIAPAGYRQTSPAPDPGPGEFGDSLATIDLAGKLPGSAERLASSNGVLFQQTSDGTITEIDAQTGTVLSQFTQPSGILDITHDGTSLWGVRDGELVAFDAGGVSNILSINVPNATALAWDGNVFWVSDSSADIIYRVNPSDGSTLPGAIAAPGAGQGTLVNMTHDGTNLWIRRFSTPNRVFEVDPSSGTALRSLDIETSHGGTAFDFDRQALWTTYEDVQLLVLMDISKPGANVTTVGGADTMSGVDFGNFELATVSGVVYEDADGDGVQDAGEIGLAGWRVFVDTNGNGLAENFESSVITGADGSYSLALGPGSHDVTAQLREPGWQPTLPDPALTTVTVTTSGEMATADFGHVLTDIGPVGAEVLLSDVPVLSNDAHDAFIASDDAGNFAAVWGGDDGDGGGIYARLYDAAGHAASAEFLVNETTLGQQQIPSIAMAGDGRFVVTWDSGTTAMARLFAADGTPLTGEFEAISAGNKESSAVGVGMDDAGNFAILTVASKDLGTSFPFPIYYVQRYDSSGNAVGSKIRVADRPGGNLDEDFAMDKDGNFVVAWWDDGILAQRYDAAGNALGSPLVVDNFNTATPTLAIAGGRFILGYYDFAGIGVRVYDFATGNQIVDIVDAVSGYMPDSAPIGIDSQGNFVVTSFGNSQLFAQRFNSDGTSHGGEFRVNTTPGASNQSAVAMRPDGGFIVGWQGEGGMSAQVYAASVPTPPPPPAPTFSIDDVSVNEGDGTATFTVTRSVETSGAVSVDFVTVDGSATAGSDYTAVSDTLNFADGQTTAQIVVAITDDSDNEGDETFTVVLSNPTGGAVIADATGEGTIVDNDAPASATDIYVSDITFDSRTRGKGGSKHDERILVTIRNDSDGDGVAETSDAVVAGASVTVQVQGPNGYSVILSGTTDANGVFTSDWLMDLPDGTYTATVTAVSYSDYTWNNLLDYDPDGNGIADDTHTIPHGASAATTAAVDSAFADEELLDNLTIL